MTTPRLTRSWRQVAPAILAETASTWTPSPPTRRPHSPAAAPLRSREAVPYRTTPARGLMDASSAQAARTMLFFSVSHCNHGDLPAVCLRSEEE
jgi:hypothetical protein